MTYEDLLRASVLDPLLAGIRDESGGLLRLRGSITTTIVGGWDLRPWGSRSMAWIPSGFPMDAGSTSYWVVLETEAEVLMCEIGSTDLPLDALNYQLERLADALWDWLAESDVAWGQRCHVPVIQLTAPWAEGR